MKREIKSKKVEIPQRMVELRLVRPPRLKSEVHKAGLRKLRKPPKNSNK